MKIFEYSKSKEYLVTPDVVEYDRKMMTKPVYDLILGCKTTKELGMFWTFEQNKLQLMKSLCQ